MNGKGWTVAGFATLIGALALNGQAAFDALLALPKVLQAFAKGLPFGLSSFLLAFALAVLVWWHADRRLNWGAGGSHGRDFRTDNLALLVACAVTMAQTAVLRGPTAALLLQALMLGILAGLLAPLAGKGVTGLVKRWVA